MNLHKIHKIILSRRFKILILIYYNSDSDKYFQRGEATMKKFRTKLLLMFGILFFVIEGIIGVLILSLQSIQITSK